MPRSEVGTLAMLAPALCAEVPFTNLSEAYRNRHKLIDRFWIQAVSAGR